MGGFEVTHYWFLIQNLAVVIILILAIFASKNILFRFNVFKVARRDYYECGFRPTVQKPIKLSIQFLIICTFFIIYDIELAFAFPLVSTLTNNSFLDFFGFILIYATMVISLVFDFDRNMLNWKFT